MASPNGAQETTQVTIISSASDGCSMSPSNDSMRTSSTVTSVPKSGNRNEQLYHVTSDVRNLENAGDPSCTVEDQEAQYEGEDGTRDSSQNRVDELPECLKRLLEGFNVPGDSKVPLDSKPEWLDMKKYKKGQEFAKKNWGGLCFGNMLSLLMGLSFRRFLEPLIFTGKSDTPFRAFKRYLSTVNKVFSWYEGNIFNVNDPAHKDIKTVRAMHKCVMDRMNALKPEDVKDRVTLQGPDGSCQGMWCKFDDEVFEEFKNACPVAVSKEYPYNVFTSSAVGTMFMTQFDMAMTQLGFIGAVLLYPKEFGIHDATREELEGFVHFWRCVGYLLGVEDRFNVCGGTLEETLELLKNVSRFWARPSIREMGRDAEHMTRCMIEGIRHYLPRVLYNSSIAYGCWVYDIKAQRSDKLLKALSWREWLMFMLSRFVFGYYIRVPGVRPTINWVTKKAVSRANTAVANNASWVRRKENKVYDYQMKQDFICTRM